MGSVSTIRPAVVSPKSEIAVQMLLPIGFPATDPTSPTRRRRRSRRERSHQRSTSAAADSVVALADPLVATARSNPRRRWAAGRADSQHAGAAPTDPLQACRVSALVGGLDRLQTSGLYEYPNGSLACLPRSAIYPLGWGKPAARPARSVPASSATLIGTTRSARGPAIRVGPRIVWPWTDLLPSRTTRSGHRQPSSRVVGVRGWVCRCRPRRFRSFWPGSNRC